MPNLVPEGRLWPIYDRIYSTKAEADAAALTDGVLIGRCVLIKYCETELTPARKLELIAMTDEQLALLDNDDEILFREKAEQDGLLMKDRLLLQKASRLVGTQYEVYYQEICYLSLNDLDGIQEHIDNLIQTKTTWNDTYLI